jgi:LmbE family N-acetylglucosaminyl deacetylase
LKDLAMKSMTRRDVLGRAGGIGGTLAIGSPATSDERKPIAPKSPLKIVVAGGHPGDPEYGCGGTIARLSDLGHEVVLLYLNNGEPPGRPHPLPPGTRVAEAGKACEILKARPLFAGQIDGESVVDRPHAEAFSALLKNEAPDAVFTHWPIDNHADHRAISMLAYDAWVRMKRSFALYYYEVSNGEDTEQFAPTHYVDITGAEPRKRDACHAHASQAPDRFYALQDQVARFRGIERGVRRAEAFIRHVKSPDVALPVG